MSGAIEEGEVELWTTPVGKWFRRTEVMAKALEIWPLHVIEEALGAEADGVLPQAIRTAELRVRRRGITLICWSTGQTSRRPPSAACSPASWTASPAPTSRSCRPRYRDSRRRWRGRGEGWERGRLARRDIERERDFARRMPSAKPA
jgi:hypothetical protein